MNAFIKGAIRNTPAMNTLMIAIMLVGGISLFSLRREVFPEFDLEIILVTVPYPGASPDEVEEGICQKLEEAVTSIDGIKKQTSVAKEGAGSLVLELKTSVSPQKVLNEVRSEVDRISTFPQLAEDPEVRQITLRQPAIKVGIIGPDVEGAQAELDLRKIAEEVRDELSLIPEVSQATLEGAKEFQIDVELSEDTLRRYGLTLQQVAAIIRRENLELPAGTIRTQNQDILVRAKNKGLVGSDIARIPLITLPSGLVLTVADVAVVRDEFIDVDTFTRVDGLPAAVASVNRTTSEDLLKMTDAVLEYVRDKKLPAGYKLLTWSDRSIEVRDRLELLIRNGWQGLVLVVLMLALFLDLKLSSWVAIGIPISLLGACAILYFAGQTLNMLTTFTFVMALGIVVDDAIVVGENIYAHRQMGKNSMQAAIDGALEVAPSVAASVATTIIAFAPLMFVSGVMGKFIAVMPLTMISILLISLFESVLVLPCHLTHDDEAKHQEGYLRRALRFRLWLSLPLRWTIGLIAVVGAFVLEQLLYPIGRLSAVVGWLNARTNTLTEYVGTQIYLPILKLSLASPLVCISSAIVLLALAGSLIAGKIVPWSLMPKIDSNSIEANVVFPDGTPASITGAATARIEQAMRDLNQRHANQGEPILKLVRRSVGYVTLQAGPGLELQNSGSHLGSVTAELEDTTIREIPSQQLIAEWRDAVGEIPGAETVTFDSANKGPGGIPIEFKLLASRDDMQALEEAVEATKLRLGQVDGVFDIRDDSSPGKFEFRLKVKPDAVAMGVPLQDLTETVRASYYGEEVMRLQRGRHEVKLMVRYPRDDRRSLTQFDQLHVRTGDGSERPLTELAEVNVARGYSEINRIDQQRSITISADLDESRANAADIVAMLKNQYMPELLAQYPQVSVRWEGQQEQTDESVRSLIIGLGIALAAMFVLLTMEFTSYFQPLLIMAIIPFGICGAVFGHALLGMPLTLFSLFGLVTLTGVVVNDSIVLIDFINQRVREGQPVEQAILESGVRRLRPIFLTSVTTIAGLLPLLFETSFQAQILIPMAVSICFGLALSTILVLILVPTFYHLQVKLGAPVANIKSAEEQTWQMDPKPVGSH